LLVLKDMVVEMPNFKVERTRVLKWCALDRNVKTGFLKNKNKKEGLLIWYIYMFMDPCHQLPWHVIPITFHSLMILLGKPRFISWIPMMMYLAGYNSSKIVWGTKQVIRWRYWDVIMEESIPPRSCLHFEEKHGSRGKEGVNNVLQPIVEWDCWKEE
jgi:hypothetical protein